MGSIANGLGINHGGVISFVGSGGKTTLMFRMAQELARLDGRTLITTSTKIWPPDKEESSNIILTQSKQELFEKADIVFKQSRHIIAASHLCTKTDKLIGFAPEFIDILWKSGRFRWILVEADGSACRPIKAPADHEPVIPLETRYLFGLIGLSVLGQPLNEENVHRINYFKEITGLNTGKEINIDTISTLIRHPKGLFKNCPAHAKTIAFLNQADLLKDLDVGDLIAEKLHQNLSDTPGLIVLGQAAKSPIILKTYSRPSIKE